MKETTKKFIWGGAGLMMGLGLCVCICLLLHNKIRAEEPASQHVVNHYVNVLANPPMPEKMEFCGEPVPLDDYSVRESLDRELTAVCYQHSSTLLCLKRSARWFPVIEKILKEEGVPEDIKYLCVAESSLSNAISSAKAVGFWQFMDATAKIYGLTVSDEVDERYDIEKSTHAACKYLKKGKENLGTWSLAAAGYNMGEGGVKKNMTNQTQNQYWNMYLNQETARYVYRILAYKLLFENPATYGVHLNERDKYQPIELEDITVESSIPSLYTFCQENGMTYKELKTWNPWLRSTKLTVPAGKTYIIKKPAKSK